MIEPPHCSHRPARIFCIRPVPTQSRDREGAVVDQMDWFREKTAPSRSPLCVKVLLFGAAYSRSFVAQQLHPTCPRGARGNDLILFPTASKIAFPIAGAIPTIGVSPEPADGRSLRSTRTLSITGMSVNRGTR
jgi:hypothetical protein